ALARDEHGAPEPSHGPNQGPLSHLILGYEAGVELPTQNRHIEPGRMVRNEYHRATAIGRRTDDPHLHAQQPTGHCPVEPCESLLRSARHEQAYTLDQHTWQRPEHHHGATPDDPRAP